MQQALSPVAYELLKSMLASGKLEPRNFEDNVNLSFRLAKEFFKQSGLIDESTGKITSPIIAQVR
jgi:hypothetical protein